MVSLPQVWDDLCNLVIRPHRCSYDPSVSLGPKMFTLGNKIYERKDFELTNPRGLQLKCSHYQPIDSQRAAKQLPCVVYCHGNCGSRCDALDAVQILLPCNITVLAFDFAGSGLSEGDYVSLGFYERQDVACVVEHLWHSGTVSRIGLWGRSMGAATSIMYSAEDHTIAAIVADSPFASLEGVMMDLVEHYQKWIPKVAVRFGINFMRRSIQNRAGFDIRNNVPVKFAAKAAVPALFAHAEGDDFIRIKHTEELYNVYRGDKSIIRFEGDHNSERPDTFYNEVAVYFYNTLISNDPKLNSLDVPKSNLARELGVGVQTGNGDDGDDNSDSDCSDGEIDMMTFMNSSEPSSRRHGSGIPSTKGHTSGFIANASATPNGKNVIGSPIVNTPLANAASAGRLPRSPQTTQIYLPNYAEQQPMSPEMEEYQLMEALCASMQDVLETCNDDEERAKLETKIAEYQSKMAKLKAVAK